MRKNNYSKIVSLVLFLIIFIPISVHAVVLPSEIFVLYKNGKIITDFESVIYTCEREDSYGNEVIKRKLCGYFGQINPENTTIYQVANNKSKEIWDPAPPKVPEDDYLIQLEKYYEELAPRATKSKTINIQSPDNILATREDRYYSVDIDTGIIEYLPNGKAQIENSEKGKQPLLIYLAALVLASVVGATVYWRVKSGK